MMAKIDDLKQAVSDAVPAIWRGDPRSLELSRISTRRHAQQEARAVREMAAAIRRLRDDLYAEMRRINGAAAEASAATASRISDAEFEARMAQFERGGDDGILRDMEAASAKRRQVYAAADAAIEPCNQLLAEIKHELQRLRAVVARIQSIEAGL